MCGIAGIFNRRSGAPVQRETLAHMTHTLSHRGPDGDGYFIHNSLGLGHRRLSIIDLVTGDQPIYNEDHTIVTVFNGEIFNYIELRRLLEAKGHRFTTESDTEVIVHAYESFGLDFPTHLNGQFAIALFDKKKERLLLIRDRVGILPLFWAETKAGDLLFGSEMKAILANGLLPAEIDKEGVRQVFRLWVNVPPRTVFRNIWEIPPGKLMVIDRERIEEKKYWSWQFPDAGDYEDKPLEVYQKEIASLLLDAVNIRLRADVPVGAYLSGGLDSSLITALIKQQHQNELRTFSVAFEDPAFDETVYQQQMISHLDTRHSTITVNARDIGDAFSQTVFHAEKPMVRTAPSPLFLLSDMVRKNGFKVVLTGEGADEVFGGYNIFKEDKIRRFWAKDPSSSLRPTLLTTIYPYLKKEAAGNAFWQAFFKRGLTDTNDPLYSHQIRWRNTDASLRRFLSPEFKEQAADDATTDALNAYIDKDILRWHPLCRAQYLEAVLLLPGNLLCSQGDRMLMSHGVEGRFPFLDHRVIEAAALLPPIHKIRGLNEKFLLKKIAAPLLPNEIVNRAKRPYRAPVSSSLLQPGLVTAEMLDEKVISQNGFFDAKAVGMLVQKSKNATDISERENMALAGIVSLQLLAYHFLGGRNNQS